MDVLLINPNSRKHNSVKELPLLTPPINLMYVAQSLINNGYNAKIIDAFALNMSREDILNKIKQDDIKIVGFPLYSCDLTMMYELTNKIKSLNKDIKIFFAGHHVSSLYKDVMLQFPNVDYLVRGEGEFVVVDLLNNLEKGVPLNKIKGLSYRENGKIFHNPERKQIEDLDIIPIPSRDLIDKNLYYSRMSKNKRVDVIITTRGCPYRCTFCYKLNDKFRIYRERSIPNVIEEMKIIESQGTKGIEIYDEMFTLKRKRILDLSREIKNEGFDFEFRIRTRVTHIDDELLLALKKIGCSVISYGVESGNQKVLDAIKKDVNLKIIETAFKKTEKFDINILGFFMIGNREETPKSIRETINFAKKLNPLYATFTVLHPYPGTSDYERAKEDGTLIGRYAPYESFPWIKLPWTDRVDDLYKYSEMAYNEFYKRPKYIYKFLKNSIHQRNYNLTSYIFKNFYKKISNINTG